MSTPKETEAKEPKPETQPEAPKVEAKTKEPDSEVDLALLADLPLPALQRIEALPQTKSVAAVESSKQSLLVVHARPLLYSFGVVKKTKSLDLVAEIKKLGNACEAGRGGKVFSLLDIRNEIRRRILN